MARPRSEEAHEKVIDAAIALFGERGIEATSMDAIARASGVSKATIYKHWTDKEALLMEVMCFAHGLEEDPGEIDTGDVQRDIAKVLSRKPPDELEEARTRMMPAFIAYSAVHPEFGSEWRHRVMGPARHLLERILARGIERGLLMPGLDLELAKALLLGPLLYWHIFVDCKKPSRTSKEIAPEVAKAFCSAFGTKRMQRSHAKAAVHSRSRAVLGSKPTRSQ